MSSDYVNKLLYVQKELSIRFQQLSAKLLGLCPHPHTFYSNVDKSIIEIRALSSNENNSSNSNSKGPFMSSIPTTS